MKKLLLLGALLAGGALCLQDVSVGHGGTYRGPGDTVPPGGGGGGGGGGPSTPGPSGPSAPGPSGPSTPGPSGPAAPGPGSNQPKAPTTQGGDSGPDLTLWQFWWGFNKDPYLNLKSHIHSGSTLTGSDDFFLGHGQQTQSKDSLKPSEETIRSKIVPALKKALENETNNDIVTGAMVALAKIGDVPDENGKSEFMEIIEPFLKDPNQEIAETAAVALGILGNPAAVTDLKFLVTDEPSERMRLVGSEAGVNYRTRAFACYGLGQIGFRTEDPAVRQDIVDALWKICESPRMSTRDVKVAAIIAMGLVPLDVAAEVPDPAAAGKNGEKASGPPTDRRAQIEYLLEFFQDEKNDNRHYLVRAHAPRAIANLMADIDDPMLKKDVAEALLPYIGDRKKGEKELNQSASLALGQLGDLDLKDKSDGFIDDKIRQGLMEATGTAGDQQSKFFALIALGQVGGRPGSSEDPMGGAEEIRKFLKTQLAKGKTTSKPWAGLAIGVMERALLDANQNQSPDSLRALRMSLKDTKTKLEVGAYAIALGIAGDLESESILLEKLDSMADDEVRGHLAIGLGLMNSVGSMETIQEVVTKSKHRGDLLKQAAIALGLLGDKNVVTTLVTQLEEAKTLSTQAAIASALGFIGDSRSVDPLIAMLENKELTDAARGFAAVALGIVADKELLPWNAKFSVNINYRANTTTLTGENGTGLLDIL
ncbi:MAG: HEAT repeat domain-containing protein [Planctomycetes bacterium]|nr:HEAT repeat domain-containing protein [Planctomycetota bacterium]